MATQSSHFITVRKNWNKKIVALCDGVKSITRCSLDNGFKGEEMTLQTTNITEFVKSLVKDRARLTYNKKTGHCNLHVHSNLWYDWVNKIEW